LALKVQSSAVSLEHRNKSRWFVQRMEARWLRLYGLTWAGAVETGVIYRHLSAYLAKMLGAREIMASTAVTYGRLADGVLWRMGVQSWTHHLEGVLFVKGLERLGLMVARERTAVNMTTFRQEVLKQDCLLPSRLRLAAYVHMSTGCRVEELKRVRAPMDFAWSRDCAWVRLYTKMDVHRLGKWRAFPALPIWGQLEAQRLGLRREAGLIWGDYADRLKIFAGFVPEEGELGGEGGPFDVRSLRAGVSRSGTDLSTNQWLQDQHRESTVLRYNPRPSWELERARAVGL
jgi:hypothetical protein